MSYWDEKHNLTCNEDCYFFESHPHCPLCEECTYCGKRIPLDKNYHRFWDYDHILARSKHGRTVVPVCGDCNGSKHDKGLKEWFRWVRRNRPDKWIQIVEYNKRKRNDISLAVHDILNE